MKRNRTNLRGGRARVAAAALALLVLTAGMAGAERGPLAVATVYANGVDFLPAVGYSGARITVRGPGGTYELHFGAGEPLSIGLFGPGGELLPDGVYSWGLTLTPTDFDARGLRRLAKKGGISPADAWQPLSGTFALRGGLVADPSLVEARPRRPEAASRGGLQPEPVAGPLAVRAAEDNDEAVAGGHALERRGAPPETALGPPPADPERLAHTDAGAALRGRLPVSRTPSTPNDEPPVRRYAPTDGKNGRE